MFSPLEQFQILPVINLPFFVITNSTLIGLFGITCVVLYVRMTGKGTLVPNRYQLIFEGIYSNLTNLITQNIGGGQGLHFFPYIFSLFTLILIFNTIGLIPYSFTVTSHLAVTFALALGSYIGINIIGFRTHKLKFFEMLFPEGSMLALAPLLVPIELVSYVFRVISLPVRLFANMMAGHILLKVIVGFSWSMLHLSGFMSMAHIFPLIILTVLFILETAVAMIQAFVFTFLTCLYINDALNLH